MTSEDIAKATVNFTTQKDGKKVSEVVVFEGTKAEVESELNAFEATLKNDAGDVLKVIERIDITKE